MILEINYMTGITELIEITFLSYKSNSIRYKQKDNNNYDILILGENCSVKKIVCHCVEFDSKIIYTLHG